jgi:16S rRNA (uracil1498-N3)-methyltransferase
MRLFFAENIEAKSLSSEETQHAVKVLRLQKGHEIQLIDGLGKLATANITEIDKRSCSYQITNIQNFDNELAHIHIAVAPTKSSDRLEWMLEKMTEIGVGTIHLIHTKRTEKTFLNLERLTKKLVSAAKQSHKYYLPALKEYKSLKEFITTNTFEQKFIAHLAEGERHYLGSKLEADKNACILIGPEGDFTDEEIALAFDTGYLPVTLGNYRLRTETAAVFGCTLLNHVSYL